MLSALLHANASSPQQTPDAFLEGPTIAHDGRSLVQFDVSGALVKVPGRPEMAAVALLPMDLERRDDIRLINEARRTEVALFLADQIDVIREITDAIRAGDNDAAQRLAQSLYKSMQPEHVRDPLLEPYAEVLSPEELTETTRILDEYWSALIRQQLRDEDHVGQAMQQRTEERLAFETFQEEIREAYEWSLRPYQQKIERIAEIVSPTPEQREAIRFAIIDYIREARLEPTDALRQQSAQRIYDILDEEQRQKLFGYVWWRL